MSEITTQPAANSIEAFQSAIASYREQHTTLASQLSQAEVNYNQQKENGVGTLRMLAGAIAAIEQLVKNVQEETKLKAELAAALKAAEPVPADPSLAPDAPEVA